MLKFGWNSAGCASSRPRGKGEERGARDKRKDVECRIWVATEARSGMLAQK